MLNKDFKIKSKVILELLEEEDNGLICETLERIMDEELMKPDDQIDLDLIDECVKMIHFFYDNELPKEEKNSVILPFPNSKNKFSKVKRIVTRVALFAGITFFLAFAGNSISVSAFHVNIFGNIVEWTQSKVILNWHENNSSSVQVSSAQIYDSLYSKLKNVDFADVMLPYYNLQEYQIKNLNNRSTDFTKSVSFTLYKGNDYINYLVGNFDSQESMDKKTLLGQYSNGEQFIYNGTKFYILAKGSSTHVLFRKQLSEYMLITSYNVDTTKKILSTIK